MNKTYGRINWENYPSDETPLNESNLNKIDVATDEIDNRVITLDTTKATKEEVSTLVQDVTFEEKTGIITIVKKNGSKVTIDTQMEKIAVNFSYNAGTQQIILTLIDGTKQYIDLSALITQYEFLDSDTVAFSIDSAGKVSAIVKEASIQEKHLQPNYLADIKVEVAKAQASQSAAAKSESNAKASEIAAAASESNAAASATKAQSYATGGTNSRAGEDTDNAKYYSQQSAQSQSAAATSADTASTKAKEAAASAATAKTSADNAAGSANLANEKANSAANSATIAVSNSNAAQQYASNAAASADTAQNYAVADTDSAKYYYEQARRISESFSGALRPMGTVTFANLPALSATTSGNMYNISDQFTTTNDFKEGAGNTIPAGANVYKTEDGKWDVLAGTPVTGVKGSAESGYRRGNVNITAENVGALSLKNGGNVTGDTSFQGKRRVHYVDDGTGRAGYDKIARFTANSAYNNAAIEIELARRTDTVPTHVAIMFAGNACYAVTCMGHTKDIFMCKESDGVWVLYVKKTHEWCTTSVLDYVHSPFADGVTVEWIVSSSANYAESLPNTEIISGSWGYIVKEAMEADGTATVLDYNDTSKKIKVGWVGDSLSQDQILGVACYASGDDDIVKAKIKDVSKATFKNWLGGVSPAGGSEYYVKNENLSNVDLNNVTTTGIYHLTGTLTNSPINGNATLYVEFDVGTPYQIFIPDYMYVMYKRNYSNGSWGNWQELNTWRPLGTTADTACAGNDSRLSNARPASDVYAWAKASSKPAYSWSEINNKPTTFTPAAHTHAYLPLAGGTMTGALNMNGNKVKLYGNNYMQANEQDINIVAAGKDMFTGYVNARVTSALQVRDTSNSSWKPVNALSFNQQSSARYKKNIANMTEEEALKLLKYRVVDYDYINEADGTGCQGLIAEEVAEICEYPVYRKPDGTIEGLDYSKFVPQLIKMVQIQQTEIDGLRQTIESLKN